jgi:amidase
MSSRDLTELALARVDTVNPSANAVVGLRHEAAVREAAAADEALASEVLGPLHGVPVTIKEAIQVAGMHSTWGNPAFRDFAAAKDATVVRRLEQAGELWSEPPMWLHAW